jgi:site-specific DNA recombinase
MPNEAGPRRVATYERVSSEDQRERETIKTQTDEIARHLAHEPGFALVGRYLDDGVSGMVPLAERPDGRRLLADAAAHRFEELWVYKVDRLGRNAVDLLVVRRRLDALGITLVSVVEGKPDLLGYDVQAVVADHYRREFARRSADGMARAAREGRYTGGIVPFGYRIEGRKQTAHLVPDQTMIWEDKSAADVVRDIYERLAIAGQSCPLIARELNALGVPTHYARDGRGVRGRRTAGVWRNGHIGNLVRNPVYRGIQSYGRRSAKRDREVIAAGIEPLVSPALWDAAQAALTANRVVPNRARRTYLLRGVMSCAICGLTYVGSAGKGAAWYRCGGQLVERGRLAGRCPSRAVRSDWVEPLVWSDIARFLRDPQELLTSLAADQAERAAEPDPDAEAKTLELALAALEAQRAKTVDLAVRGHLSDHLLEATLARIGIERDDIGRRLNTLRANGRHELSQEVVDRLAQVRERPEADQSLGERAELVRALVAVNVDTAIGPDGRKSLSLLITYRLPDPALAGGVLTVTRRWHSERPRRSAGPRVLKDGPALKAQAQVV